MCADFDFPEISQQCVQVELNFCRMVWYIFYQRSFRTRKPKGFLSVFIHDVIVQHCKNFVPRNDLAGPALFSRITAGLDNQMNRFVTRTTSSAISSSNAASCFRLSSLSTPNGSLTSATSIFSSQRHQDRLPDDLHEDAPSRPKLHAYPQDNYSCSFRDLLSQLGCRCMFCFTK